MQSVCPSWHKAHRRMHPPPSAPLPSNVLATRSKRLLSLVAATSGRRCCCLSLFTRVKASKAEALQSGEAPQVKHAAVFQSCASTQIKVLQSHEAAQVLHAALCQLSAFAQIKVLQSGEVPQVGDAEV
jgi:hypothetical protein